eukprot:6190464-Pleurochrysis_carterae.AAC.1
MIDLIWWQRIDSGYGGSNWSSGSRGRAGWSRTRRGTRCGGGCWRGGERKCGGNGRGCTH